MDQHTHQLLEEARQKFHSLLIKDKTENLRKRLEFFMAKDPDFSKTKLRFVPRIIDHQWVVWFFYQKKTNEPALAYSIGFFYNFNQPEVMIIGGEMKPEGYQALIDHLGNFIKSGGTFLADKDYSELFQVDGPLKFEQATKEILKEFPYGFGRAFYARFQDLEEAPPILVFDMRT